MNMERLPEFGEDDARVIPLTKERVQARVENWRTRVAELFEHIAEWATVHDWRIDRTGSVLMSEDMMHEFGVTDVQLPTLRLDSGSRYALFKPKALWVFGANGRIDLYTSSGTYILVDTADFDDVSVPHWMIFHPISRSKGSAFTPELIPEITEPS